MTDDLPQARVYASGGVHNFSGWFYRIGHEAPVGPFDTTIEAGRAARAAIIAITERKAPDVGQWCNACRMLATSGCGHPLGPQYCPYRTRA